MKDRPDTLPENLDWNPELAFPLGEKEFGLSSVHGFDTRLFHIDSLNGLPAWVQESELHMAGILDFDLSSITENLDALNRILFRVNFYNQFPHRLQSQAYFLDLSRDIIDSLFVDGPVETPPAQVGASGESIVTGYARHDALIEEARIPGLEEAVSILFRSTVLIEDVDTTLIPLYPTLHLDIDAGLMLDMTLEY